MGDTNNLLKMKKILFILAILIIASAKPPDCNPYVDIKFYSKGNRIAHIETGTSYYNPVPINADSVVVKIVK